MGEKKVSEVFIHELGELRMRFLFGVTRHSAFVRARPSLFRPPFFKYYARRGASMIAPSLPIASTGQPSIASWQSASSSGVSGCL